MPDARAVNRRSAVFHRPGNSLSAAIHCGKPARQARSSPGSASAENKIHIAAGRSPPRLPSPSVSND